MPQHDFEIGTVPVGRGPLEGDAIFVRLGKHESQYRVYTAK